MRLISFLFISTVLFTGCNSTVNTYISQPEPAEKQYVKDRRIITDGELDDVARVTEIITQNLPNNLKLYQVEICNTTSEPRGICYKFDWFDEHGIQINTPTSIWIAEALEGKEYKYIQGVTPTTQAKNFKLHIILDERAE